MGFLFLYWLFLGGAIAYVIAIGNPPTRRFAAMVVAAAFASLITNLLTGDSEPNLFNGSVELALLIGSILFALIHDKFWMIWFSGFQLASVITFGAVLLIPKDDRWLLMTMIGFWAIPAVLVMTVGAAKDNNGKREQLLIEK